ncbi:hypothetical protein PORY_001823 [Pneumocystis oryctolagi]|uniref:Uncharacterized protein n=1 Tax=Pneumocystis oryctolagi TaxID=42067 RepID=A0ACB7CBJ3_9ASCO|nr:hypothetical protein PORY_001823 [Pneumocystis oryctolagi]
MSSGLLRRRVCNANPNESVEISSSHNYEKKNLNNSFQGKSGHDIDNVNHKIVYDPLDIQESQERSKQPCLTLMEEILLLGLKDKQGYLPFWNDNISYILRGCIILELAFRGRIQICRDSFRRRYPLSECLVEVVNDKITGEVLLDETLKMMKTSEKMTISSWVNLMSGETWNFMKIGYQLKQVRERLAKGLVDKGILRTEKRNFLLFDMTTHPVSNYMVKDDIRNRLIIMLTAPTIVLPNGIFFPETIPMKHLRMVTLVCAAYSANVLDTVFSSFDYEIRERAFNRVDEFFKDFSQWPFTVKYSSNIGCMNSSLANVIAEEISGGKDKELQLEVIVAVLQKKQYTEKDAIYSGLKSMIISGSVGLVISTVQNAIMKDTENIKSIMRRTGRTVGIFAVMGGLFSFTQVFISNIRKKDDSLNPFIGGLVSGSIGAAQVRPFPVVIGYGLGLGCILGLFNWCGGTLNGVYHDVYGKNTGILKETLFKTEYRRPRSEIVKSIGSGRGV